MLLTKRCSTCEYDKDISKFYKRLRYKDGIQSQCIECVSGMSKALYHRTKPERTLQILEYTRSHPEMRSRVYKKWSQANPHIRQAINAHYRAAKLQRTPKWLTREDLDKMEMFYEFAIIFSKESKIKWHVDHIIPLQGKNISGLHVPTNLQFLKSNENFTKSNKFEGAFQ